MLGPLPDDERFARDRAARSQRHPRFPHGTNVELAQVDARDRVRILIWERGVGPTESSGTGACAAAVAAIAYGGRGALVEVVAPGGTQRVEWTDEGLFLTGWAELVADGRMVTWLMRDLQRRPSKPSRRYSPAEEQFNRRRRTVGLVAGAVVLLSAARAADAPAPGRRTGWRPSWRWWSCSG